MTQPHTTVPVLDEVVAFTGRDQRSYVDGDWLVPSSDERLILVNPATGESLCAAAKASADDVDKAARSARRAFDDGSWSDLAPAERGNVLLRLASLMEDSLEELAQIETLNQGKSIHVARGVDLAGAIAFVRYVAGLTTKPSGETFEISNRLVPGVKYSTMTRRQPIGVVGAIAPWNFPLLIGLWKVAPALAAGCSVVLKPSELTPLTSLRLAELATEAGVPAGVFNVVIGDSSAGRALVAHPAVDKISFTGSTRTGKEISRAAADRVLRTTLELGGKNPAIFFGDANLDAAVPGAVMGSFFNGGQVCAASSRLYVARSIYDEFVERLSQAVTGTTFGAGLDVNAQCSPLVSSTHRDRVHNFVQEAVASGARVTAGGAVPEMDGFYFPPTVIVDAAPDAAICRDEVFGPVVTVTPFETDDEALQLANGTDMGLTASIWTNDLGKAMRIIPKINAGTVWVNTHNIVDAAMPFGGFKQSGIGRDMGNNALEPYTEIKSVCIAY